MASWIQYNVMDNPRVLILNNFFVSKKIRKTIDADNFLVELFQIKLPITNTHNIQKLAIIIGFYQLLGAKGVFSLHVNGTTFS